MTWTLLLALACAASPEDHLESARKNLQSGQYDPAINDAAQGLQASPDDKTAFGLQSVLLEANARAGNAAETKKTLEMLGTAHPDRLTPSLYSASAQQLKDAGKSAEQIEVLDAGLKRFPDDPTLKSEVEKAKQTSDPAALERLKSLGYIQ